MKFAVIQFPGSNCDFDLLWAIRDVMQAEAEFVWHEEKSIAGFDGVLIPGGFSYGDYLRCGAIASFSNVMPEIKRLAAEGKPVQDIRSVVPGQEQAVLLDNGGGKSETA